MTRTPTGAGRHSPCVGICRLDAQTGWCEGCGRSGAEIASWIDADDTRRLEIWQELPDRLAKLGMDTRVLPWTADEVVDRIAERLQSERGAWAVAPAHTRLFAFLADSQVTVTVTDQLLVARSRTQSFSLTRHDKLRAFTDVPEEQLTALGLPKGRAVLPEPRVITDLGADARGHDEQSAPLFDLGLGTTSLRVGIRNPDPDFGRRIAALVGRPYNDVVGTLIEALGLQRFAVVAETVLTRVETSIAADELPALIAEARDPNRRMVLPAGLVPSWAATMLIGRTVRS